MKAGRKRGEDDDVDDQDRNHKMCLLLFNPSVRRSLVICFLSCLAFFPFFLSVCLFLSCL